MTTTERIRARIRKLAISGFPQHRHPHAAAALARTWQQRQRMRSALLVALVSLAPTAEAGERCGGGDLDAICDDPRVEVTAGPNPQDGPILESNTTYTVAGFAPGKRSYVVVEAQATGSYALYVGGPPITAKLCDQRATCTADAPRSCMHSVATYDLVAGKRYEIELGAIPAGQRILVHVKAPAGEDRVAFAGARVTARASA